MNNEDVIKIINTNNPAYENFPKTPRPEVYNLEVFDGSFIKRLKKFRKFIMRSYKE